MRRCHRVKSLAKNPAWLDRTGVKVLFERALRAETGADLAFYPQDSVAGRLRPGAIRSGDIYSLESWQESVEVVDVHGSHLSTQMGRGNFRRPEPRPRSHEDVRDRDDGPCGP